MIPEPVRRTERSQGRERVEPEGGAGEVGVSVGLGEVEADVFGDVREELQRR
jgi:hypothetical protein